MQAEPDSHPELTRQEGRGSRQAPLLGGERVRGSVMGPHQGEKPAPIEQSL